MLAACATAAGLATLVLSLARGPAIAFVVALAVTALPGSAKLSAKRLSTFFFVVVLAAVALYASKGLWLARLNAPSTAQFDRPATWVAGLRLVHDHPLVGVGSTHVVAVVGSSPKYSQTQFGQNHGYRTMRGCTRRQQTARCTGSCCCWRACCSRSSSHGARARPDVRYLKAGLLGLALVFFTNNLFNHPEVMLVVLLAGVAIATAADPATAVDPATPADPVTARFRPRPREARSMPRASAPEPSADAACG